MQSRVILSVRQDSGPSAIFLHRRWQDFDVAWLDQLLFGFSHQVVGESSWVICFAQRFRPSVSMSLRDIRSIRRFPRWFKHIKLADEW
jgi:hypothetical protein